MDWIDLPEDRDRWRVVVIAVMNLRVSWNAENFLTSLRTGVFKKYPAPTGVPVDRVPGKYSLEEISCAFITALSVQWQRRDGMVGWMGKAGGQLRW